MAKNDLKTNYQDQTYIGQKKYRMIENGDGTVSFEDVTQYTNIGDKLHGADLNNMNTILKDLTSVKLNNIVQDEIKMSTIRDTSTNTNRKKVQIKDSDGNILLPEVDVSNVYINDGGYLLKLLMKC